MVAPPTHVGAPLRAGELAGAVSIAGATVSDPWAAVAADPEDPAAIAALLETYFPQEGDPGIRAPTLELAGEARYGVVEGLELGAHARYVAYDWGRQGFGVLPIPDAGPLVGAGLEVTGGHWWGKFGVGGSLDATWWSMPYATFVYDGPAEYAGGYAIGEAAEWYALADTGNVTLLRISGAGGASLRAGVFEGSLGAAVVPVLSNVGFSNKEQPLVKPTGLSVVPVLDLGLRVRPVRVGVQGWYAPGAAKATDGLATGFGARATVEVRVPVRGGG